MRQLWLAIATAIFTTNAAPADVPLTHGSTVHFASAAEGADALARDDDFLQRLSPFDRAARMKTDQPVSREKFREFVRANALNWNDAEQRKIAEAIAAIRPALEKISAELPSTVIFVKTSGNEEGNAFYTRGTAVMFPMRAVDQISPTELRKTIAHELFHVLSRAHGAMREKLYAALGFTHCAEPKLPAALESRRLTNPDAPRNDHAIHLRAAVKEIEAVPVLIASTDHYDVNRGGEFFNYLQLKFLVVNKAGAVRPDDLLDPQQVTGFFEQVGRNTDYIIHPEEILAENFALLVTGAGEIKSPEILARLRALIARP